MAQRIGTRVASNESAAKRGKSARILETSRWDLDDMVRKDSKNSHFRFWFGIHIIHCTLCVLSLMVANSGIKCIFTVFVYDIYAFKVFLIALNIVSREDTVALYPCLCFGPDYVINWFANDYLDAF
ncbi:hypothetical protein BC940DRAFT_360037 [Gongronella butleri]|nr:hypothetical protein BC940DRAFT_360037 [Gongronella butleri]